MSRPSDTAGAAAGGLGSVCPHASSRPDAPELGVGMVGYAFMGAAHSQAWRTVAAGVRPAAAAAAGRAVRPGRRRRGRRAPARLGGLRDRLARADRARRRAAGGHRARPATCTPRSPSRPWPAGKHVLCEKPLANTLAEAEAMAAAAAPRPASSGVRAMVGFNYRRVPAIALARRLVTDGRIGTLRHVRAAYLQDWLIDPAVPLTWRLQAERAGSGALGDIGAHAVDLAQYLSGAHLIAGVSAADGHLRRGAARCAGAAAAMPSWARSPWTTPRCSPRGCRSGRAGLVRGHPVRRRAEERAAHRAQRRARQPGLRPGAAQRAEFYDRTETRSTAGFRRILVTEPGHPYLAAGGRPGTCSAGSTRSSTRPATCSPPSRPATTRNRRSPTGSRSSGCSTPSRPAPRTTAPGRRSRRPEFCPSPA